MNLGNWFNRLTSKKIVISIDKRELHNLLAENPIILEAGTFDGEDSEDFSVCFPKGQIHSFECLPHYFQIAKQKLQMRTNISLYPYALSNSTQAIDFYVSTRSGSESASSSILPPKLHIQEHPEIKFERKIEVQAITIDDWALRYQIPRIDFMWLDLQGAELKALQGADRMLSTVKGIFTEVSLIETYEKVPLYSELKTFLMSRGFKVEKEFLPYKDMGNVLFVKE